MRGDEQEREREETRVRDENEREGERQRKRQKKRASETGRDKERDRDVSSACRKMQRRKEEIRFVFYILGRRGGREEGEMERMRKGWMKRKR